MCGLLSENTNGLDKDPASVPRDPDPILAEKLRPEQTIIRFSHAEERMIEPKGAQFKAVKTMEEPHCLLIVDTKSQPLSILCKIGSLDTRLQCVVA